MHAASRVVLRNARVLEMRTEAMHALKYGSGTLQVQASAVLEVFELLDEAHYRAELAEAEKVVSEAQKDFAWMKYHQKWPRSPDEERSAENDLAQVEGLTRRLNEAQAAVEAIKAKAAKPTTRKGDES